MQESNIENALSNIFSQRDYTHLSNLQSYIPIEPLEEYKIANRKKIRDRVFSMETTLFGMIMQAGQNDKSKQFTVTTLSKLHAERKAQIERDREQIYQVKKKELEELKKEGKKKQGRPQKRFLVVQKSKEMNISQYPSSYDEATIRFPLELMKKIFIETSKWHKAETNSGEGVKWNGKNVYVVDGTTFKTQDTKPLREYFDCDREKTNQPVPVGRLEGLINLYLGGLVAVEIDKYTSSEGKMFKKLFNQIPEGTIVLGDDLYSKYGYFSYCKSQGIDLIAQSKSNPKEEIVREISKGDTIVKWVRGKKRESVLYKDTDEMVEYILLRKIQVNNIRDKNKVVTIYTTLLDENKYSAQDIATLYCQRWEIEISFRQIKSILKMEYLRGKTVDMVKKEIYAHLILYNIIRKMLRSEDGSENGTFSPLGDKVQVGTTMVKGAYVDKRGRSYSRWNAGRPKRNIKENKGKEKAE